MARTLNDAYGRYEAYRQVFPDVNAARQAEQLIKTIGGEEGVAGMHARLSEMEEIDASLASGDPKVLAKVAEIAGPGLAKLAPAFFEHLEKSNPAEFEQAVRPVLMSALEAANFAPHLGSLIEALNGGDTARAQQLAQSLAQWFVSQRDAVQKQRTATPDPREQQISEREKQLNEREEKAFTDAVTASTRSHAASAVNRELDTQLKGTKMNAETRAFLAKQIYTEIGELTAKDPNFQSQANGVMKGKNRDSARASAFYNGRISSVVEQAAKTVIARYRQTTAAISTAPKQVVAESAKPATGTIGATGTRQPVKVTERPLPGPKGPIDYAKSSTDDLARGRAYLKDGRYVTWR